jgi:hypothetical protein
MQPKYPASCLPPLIACLVLMEALRTLIQAVLSTCPSVLPLVYLTFIFPYACMATLICG